MPLPKAPTKPATLLDLDAAVLARATRTRGRDGDDAPEPQTDRTASAPIAAIAPVSPLAPVAAIDEAARARVSPATGGSTSVRPSGGSALFSPPVGPRTPAAVTPLPLERAAPVAAPPAAPRSRAPGRGAARPTTSTAPPAAEAVPTPIATAPRAVRSRRDARPDTAKLFVLDTNVLMHDPSSLFRFAEHDVFLPIVTLEELDNHKKGMSEVARSARQVSRSLDALVGDVESGIEQGISLSKLGNREAGGRLFLQTQALQSSLPDTLATGKADNQILGVVQALQSRFGDRQVVLVSKDINMRIKARALGLPAEDYHNDQVIEDLDMLYAGTLALPADFWDRHSKGMESWQQGGYNWYRISGPAVAGFMLNQFVYLEGDMPLAAQVKELNGKTAVLQTLRDYGNLKNAVWGVTARNREQNFALNLLMNPEVDFVTLLGQAGTGKTLLALAAGLSQTLEHKRYSEIIVTRATVPVGEDIGYLPGTEEEKMQPWMGALEDNLEVLTQGNGAGGEWGRAAASDLIRSRIKVKALSFMRGRTFLSKYLIIDEAQNLTPKQMKTLITRAGPGTKVICLGNIAQIDTPYLTESSSGLSYVVDRFKGWAHGGHVTLQRGERSRLADFATDAL
jgi:PhoH-like ATPase